MDRVQLNLTDNAFGKINRGLYDEKKNVSKFQISSYMHHARTMSCSNDHILPLNVDIDCNNTKQNTDTDKKHTDSTTIINEGYHSSSNTDI